MPQPARRKLTDQILIQLIEADVDIGFGLVDEAKIFLELGRSEFSARAIEEAAQIVVAIEHRLQQLTDSESLPFVPLLAELRHQIESVELEE